MPNEQEQFLKDLENDQTQGLDILEQPLTPEPEKEEAETDDEGGFGGEIEPKNRRERRLMRKLQEERESAIFMAGKVESMTEAARTVTEESDYLKAVEQIYGNDTPEKQVATELLKKAIVGARDDAKRQAIEELRAERQKEIEETRQAESELDNVLEDIEDTYDVTLTEAQERAYFGLLERMSPKDRDGNVIGLADPHAVWDVFKDRLQKKGTDNRAKDLSARSMVQSGTSKESTLTDDSQARFLRENGII